MSGKDVVMGNVEYGTCELCGQEGPVQRKYFHYKLAGNPIKCDCHNGGHADFIKHCKDCVPAKPATTQIVLDNMQMTLATKTLEIK